MAIIIQDAFTDTNGTGLASHTISPTNTVGAAWTVPSGTVDIQSNRARATTVAGYGWGILDSSHADGTISVVVRREDTDELYLVFRYTDTSNWWGLAWNSADSTVRLYKVVGGSASEPFGSTTKTFTINTDYTMQVVLSGNSISATIDGGSTLGGSDSFNASATRHGFIAGVTTNAGLFDDWTMDVAAAGNPWYYFANQ